MKKIYLSAILLFFAVSSFAQQWGYVITVNNDTLHCAKVKRALVGQAIRYKVNDRDDFKSINTDDIKEYQLSNDSAIWRAEVLKPGGKPYFLRVQESGRICLYQQLDTYSYSSTNYMGNTGGYNTQTNTSSTKNWFVSKDNGLLIELKTSGLFLFGASHDDRKAALAEMFADDPQVAAAYKADDSFSFKKIQKFVEQYNHDAAVRAHL